MILRLLWNIPLTWMIFMSVLKNDIILIAFDDKIVDTLNITKVNLVTDDIFIRGKQLNIYLVFIKILDLIQHTILLWKFETKQALQKFAFNNSII